MPLPCQGFVPIIEERYLSSNDLTMRPTDMAAIHKGAFMRIAVRKPVA